jgi:hypothetical protein
MDDTVTFNSGKPLSSGSMRRAAFTGAPGRPRLEERSRREGFLAALFDEL